MHTGRRRPLLTLPENGVHITTFNAGMVRWLEKLDSRFFDPGLLVWRPCVEAKGCIDRDGRLEELEMGRVWKRNRRYGCVVAANDKYAPYAACEIENRGQLYLRGGGETSHYFVRICTYLHQRWRIHSPAMKLVHIFVALLSFHSNPFNNPKVLTCKLTYNR